MDSVLNYIIKYSDNTFKKLDKKADVRLGFIKSVKELIKQIEDKEQ